MTNNEVHEQIVLWLHNLLGIVVIKDRQQADRPARPYGMVDLSTWRHLSDHVDDIDYATGTEFNSQGKREVLATPELELEWVFLFFVYGEQSDNLLRRLQSAVHLPQVQEPLRPLLVIHEVSAANSIPELVNEKWEPRAQLNIIVRGKSSDAFVVDIIEEHEFYITGERA